MSFVFHEQFSIEIPKIEEQLSNFSEMSFAESHGLIVEIAAIHEGVTSNYTYYSARALENSLGSWLQPYPKPIILHHNDTGEAVGRVIGARMDQEDDHTPYVRLQAAITDPSAVQKIIDKRYLTGSVGGKASEALCSICKADWAEASDGAPCAHRRGRVYRGQVATLEMDGLSFKEYSFVNIPSDVRSGIRDTGEAAVAEGDEWVKTARFFALDLGEESIVEYSESNTIDILGEMKKKEALPIYREMKGAFLEAQVINNLKEDSENTSLVDTNDIDGITESDSEESQMAKETNEEVAETEEDILSISEQLSEDLSSTSNTTEEVEESDEDETSEPAEEAVAEEDSTEDTAEEVEEDSTEEAPEAADEESDETPEEVEEAQETETQEEETEQEQAQESELNTSEESEVEEASSVESNLSELEDRIQELVEENSRLKASLHRTLAERVVDAKIAVGLLVSESRSEEVALHSERSASSLADSLRDIAAMPKPSASVSELSQGLDLDTEIVEQEENVTTINSENDQSIEESTGPEDRLITEFSNALLGRRSNQL